MSSVFARRSGIKRGYPMKASTKIGAVVAVFLSNGLAVPFAAADGTSQFAGVSTFERDNQGADGEMAIEVEHQEIAFLNSGDVVNSSVGSTAYFTDATTVSIDSDTDSRPIAGTITQLDGDLVWISPAVA
ncbi:hypothetical protein LZT07_13740 [Vibrio fluvialis]|uniref:hypothetical protein n=1 Tax=Vibrio fluvialis TaxID=676 RepID=UPI001F29D14C|nr:hypothetical protein [Vibrio fluvialis]MCE7638382.1 hypothetical protein [Vibrio fluvialis]